MLDDGTLPMKGGWPTLLEWGKGRHPARRLPDDGVRLTRITVHHPEADWLRHRLSDVVTGVPLTFVPAAEPAIGVTLRTPGGLVRL